MKYRFYRDELGYAQAQVSSPFEVLGWFLEEDVQGTVIWCRELLELIEQAESGALTDWDGTGNAHTLILKSDVARIETEFRIPPIACELSLKQMKTVLTDWLKMLTQSTEVLNGWDD